MKHETLGNVAAEPVQAQNQGASALVGTVINPKRYPGTTQLKRGEQARMMAAAAFSSMIGTPIDTLLTINAAHLQRIGEGGVFAIGHLWDGLKDLLELLRKWLDARGIPCAYIWVREYSRRGYNGNGQSGEHWHIALYLPKRYRLALAKQVAEWTGEGLGDISPKKFTSVGCAWQLKSGRGSSEKIAAYLGKAEPSTITKYGQRVPNLDKPERHWIGGNGEIQGKRCGICKGLGATAQDRAGYVYIHRGEYSAE